MATDWKSLAKETVHSFDADEVRGMWNVDFRRAAKVFLADHEDEIAAERRGWKRALRRTNAVVFGLAKRLAPPRRLVFALALLLTLLAVVESSGGDSFSPQASWAFFALFVSVLALAFLLAMELVDKLHFKDELVMARDLQAQLVPRVLPEVGAFELGAFNRIANTVGGDLYAFEPLPDGRLAVLFGDASGHGMAAGLVMAVTHAIFRTQLPVDPSPDAMIEFPWLAIRPECRVQTSRMGSNRFRIDIPRYLDFYRQGRLLLDEMVSRRGHLDDLNEAFRAMKAGEVARTVLTFD